MKKLFLLFFMFILLSVSIYAGPPFNNLEGVGGVAFNPLAYLAGQNKITGSQISKGQFAKWYVHLKDVDVDWSTIGAAGSVYDRVEGSFGYENIAPTGKNIQKYNYGVKVLLLKENYNNNKYIPAVSVGGIYKRTSNVAAGVKKNGSDFYLVATKFFTDISKPILLSAGLLSTKGRVTGVFGYDNDSDITFFGNADIIAFKNTVLGFEYKQGAQFDTFKNANYWNAHLAWLANKNLTLVGAYVDAGDEKSTTKVGLGGGAVVSAHYAF